MGQFASHLSERKFVEHKSSVKAFVEADLRSHKGNRERAITSLIMLLENSADARRKIATEIVEREYQAIKDAEEEKRLTAEKASLAQFEARNTAARIKRHEKIQKAFKALTEAAHQLSDVEIHAYFGPRKGAAHALVEKYITTEIYELLDTPKGKKIRRVFEDIRSSRDLSARWRSLSTELNQNAEKAASFDRMVTALDAITVGGKLLGDCTGGDLLREAAKLDAAANEITAQSVFYKQLAGIVGKTVTVREASNRVGIVGLLNNHYKEAA